MYRRIVIGFDGSEGAQDAVALGRLLADRTDAELVLAGVLPHPGTSRLAEAMLGSAVGDAEQDLQDRVLTAAAAVGARAEVSASDSAAHGLHDLAEEMDADVVVLGSSKASAGHVRCGRTAMHLLHGSPSAIALAPAGYRFDHPQIHVIGVAIDGSEESHEALRAAVGLADGATLRLMSVAASLAGGYWGYGSWGYGLPELAKVAQDAARADLDDAAAAVPDELRASTTLLKGDAAQALVYEAEKGVDLLCLGSRGYGPVRRVLLGSVSAGVVKDAPCPILVVPRSGVRAAGDEAPSRAAGAAT